MVAASHKGVKLVAKQLNIFGFNRYLKKINKILITATNIDSPHKSGKNFITLAWPTSTTIIYNNPEELSIH
jgi:hypothetical protein